MHGEDLDARPPHPAVVDLRAVAFRDDARLSGLQRRSRATALDPDVVPFLAAAHRLVRAASRCSSASSATRRARREARRTTASRSRRAAAPRRRRRRCAVRLLDETEMATYARRSSTGCTRDGALGAFWWCWADYADELRATPPFDRAPHELTFGIVRTDGTAKPVAQALALFAREARTRRRSQRSRSCSSLPTTPICRRRTPGRRTRASWSSTREDDPGHRRLLGDRTGAGGAGGARRLWRVRRRAQRSTRWPRSPAQVGEEGGTITTDAATSAIRPTRRG